MTVKLGQAIGAPRVEYAGYRQRGDITYDGWHWAFFQFRAGPRFLFRCETLAYTPRTGKPAKADFMVEHAALLLRPWTALPGSGGPPERPGGAGNAASARQRDVFDPATGRPLGFVRRPVRPFAWLMRQADEIYETLDCSLLATLWRPWFVVRSWEIYDAENKRRGIIYGHSVLDGAGHRLARFDAAAANAARFIAADGTELATLQGKPGDELLLAFTGAADPFTRMALLGAALSRA